MFFQANIDLSLTNPASPDGYSVQRILLPHIFATDKAISGYSVMILLKMWLSFPPEVIDQNLTGILYLLLYTTTWIFGCIRSKSMMIPQFAGVVKDFQLILLGIDDGVMTEAAKCMEKISDCNLMNGMPEDMERELFWKTLESILEPFLVDFSTNLTQLFGQIIQLSDVYRDIGIGMIHVNLTMCVRKKSPINTSLQMLLNSLPFLQNPTWNISAIITTATEDGSQKKNRMDLISQGKVSPATPLIHLDGTAKQTCDWLSRQLGIEASNKLFGLMN